MSRRLFGGLCGLVALVNLGRVGFAPLLEPLRAAFGAGPAAVGLVASAAWFGTAAARLPAGYLLTRISRRRAVIGTGATLVAGAVAAALAPSLRALQAAALVLGIASGAYFVVAVPLIGDLYPERVGRMVGIHGTAAQTAAVAAPGLVVATLAVADWRAVFWLLAAAAAAVTLLLAVLSATVDLPSPGDGSQRFRAALAHWRVLLAGVAIVAAAGFVWQGVFNFYVSFLTAEKGLSPGRANLALTALFAAGVPAFAISGRLADRLPLVPYLLGLLVADVVATGALLVADGFAALVVVSLVLGYVVHGIFPAIDTYLLGAVPAPDRSSAYAIFSGTALSLEAGGSGAVGLLTGAGYSFGEVFLGFAAGLAVVVAALAAVYFVGAFPGTARPRGREREEAEDIS